MSNRTEARWQRSRARARYELRKFWRKGLIFRALIAVAPLYLFLALLVPAAQAPLDATGIDFPKLQRENFFGQVCRDADCTRLTRTVVLSGEQSTATDSDGRFELSFPSGASKVTLVLVHDNIETPTTLTLQQTSTKDPILFICDRTSCRAEITS